MQTRSVRYTSHAPSNEVLHKHFVMAEIEPPEGPRHAFLVPRAWTPITPLPEAEGPNEPLITALFLVELAPLDWEAAGSVGPRRFDAPPFRIDVFEVTGKNPLLDVKVRQALWHAIDLDQAMVLLYKGLRQCQP